MTTTHDDHTTTARAPMDMNEIERVAAQFRAPTRREG
jgi:hypothetical protein